MAEDKPGVKNKGLLIASVVVGLIVVLLYNYQINQVRKAGRGESVEVLAFTQSRDAGERIEKGFFKRVRVDLDFIDGLGDVINLRDNSESEIIGEKLKVRVQAGLFLRWGHIQGYQGERASATIRDGMESFTVDIDPRLAPGMMLSIGDNVALLGIVRVQGKKTGTRRIIEPVRVLAIGGVTAKTLSGRSIRNKPTGVAQRTFRSLVIEVMPDTAVRLNNILTHVEGPIRVDVLSPNASGWGSDKPKILQELRDLPAVGGSGR